MTLESKNAYRKQLLKNSRKKHLSEYEYLEKIFDPNEHIGFKLFKQKSSIPVFVIYIFSIIALTISISFILSKYFISLRIIGFLILLIPVNQIIIQIVNQFLTRVVPTKIIPKLDFTLKGIPEDAKTMVVIPTIISDTKKIKEMFDTLESFYLVNKTENLYFSLLGDARGGTEKEYDYDREISKFGREYAENLNKKYKKDIFYFLYLTYPYM